MADDTRQPKPVPQTAEDLSREALTVDPAQKAFTGQQWVDAKTGKPHRPPQFENANALAGGTENTAGGKVPDVTLSNAFEGSLKWSDFTELPKRPCVRDGFLTGLGAGFAIGGLRLVFRGMRSISSTVLGDELC